MPPLHKSLKFDRNQILNKYWDLADLDPEKTKGNILGQLKALDSLCEELAAGDKPRSPANRTPSLTSTAPAGCPSMTAVSRNGPRPADPSAARETERRVL